MGMTNESLKLNNGEEHGEGHKASLHWEETDDGIELEDVEISSRLVF